MAANVYVSVSGPALSFLLYENVKSSSDQEGFLLGEIISHVTDTISDSQMRGEKMETLISVNSLMPIPKSVNFYNGIGKINHDKLKGFLKEKEKEVIGWFSFRRNSVLSPYLREKLLHKELCSSLPHLSSEHFTMCLLNTSVSMSGSTHMFNHKFIRYRHRMFESLPVQIHNLGEAPQSEYKLVPSTACLSESFNNIVSSLRASHTDSSDAVLVCNIQGALQVHLRNLINDVEQSEGRIADLEREIDLLRLKPAPVTNEILLPQILKEAVPIPGSNNNSNNGNSNKIETSTPDVHNVATPVKAKESQNNNAIVVESNHLSSSKEEPTQMQFIEGSSKSKASHDLPVNSNDAFDFVNEVKIQMSQPQNVQSSSDISSKRTPERGRGGSRGFGRGTRKASEKSSEAADNSSNLRCPLQSQTTDTTSAPVHSSSPNINNINSKPPRGYAQAVKRTDLVTRSTLPQATSTNGAPTSSHSQKY